MIENKSGHRNENQEQFRKCWEKFVTRLEGKMMTQSKKQALTFPLLGLILSDARLNWGSEYEEGGRWLMNFSKEQPENGKRIRQILLEEMQFSELSTKKDAADSFAYVIPLAGAAAGLGISHALKAGLLVQAVSTVIPAAVLYPSVKAAGESMGAKRKERAIKEYLQQLDQYRLSIEGILGEC